MAILSVMRDLDRTLLKVRWQARGDCVVFLEDLSENHPRICGRLKEYSGFTSKMSRFSVKTEHGAARCAGTVFAVFINERIYDTTTLNDTER